MHLPGENEWSLGRAIGEEGPRSFWVDVNEKHYHRNGKWLRATPGKIEPTVTIQDLTEPSEPGESSSANVSLPTMPVSAEVVQCVNVGLQLGEKVTSVDTKTLL